MVTKKLVDYIGKNEKTKIIAKLHKKGQGAPAREPVFTEDDRKHMMAYAYKKQEELKVKYELSMPSLVMFLFHRNWRLTVKMLISTVNGLTRRCSKNSFRDLETFRGSLNDNWVLICSIQQQQQYCIEC